MTASKAKKPKRPKRRKLKGDSISEVLRDLPEQFTQPTITLDALTRILSGRSYGLLLLVLALPNLIPIPAPGLSAVLGLPLIFVTFQLMIGRKAPWFPKFIADRRLKSDSLAKVCARILPKMQWLERFIKPRMTVLVNPPADRIIAFICVGLAVLIMLPIPLGNALPALAICLFAIAILQRDGVFVVLGGAVALLSVTLISAFANGVLSLFAMLGL